MLEDLDIKHDMKKGSSPKSAHHAMGLEAADYCSLDGDAASPKKQDYGDSEEAQRKGLWRSIFGYFRGPKDQKPADSKSDKAPDLGIEETKG